MSNENQIDAAIHERSAMPLKLWPSQPGQPSLSDRTRASAKASMQNILSNRQQKRDFPPLQNQAAPVGIPQSPIAAALTTTGSQPSPPQPSPVSSAMFGANFPSGSEVAGQVGSRFVAPPGTLPRMTLDQFGAQQAPGPSPATMLAGMSSGPGSLQASMLPTSPMQQAFAGRPRMMESDLGDPTAAAGRFNAAADASARQQSELARALGTDRHNASPQGQRVAGDIARVTSTYKPDFGPGAAMASRENAIAANAQPAGPDWAERANNSRQTQQSLLGRALSGGYSDGMSMEDNVRMLSPGTTLRGTSADGTPVIISRGNAGTVDDPTLERQQNDVMTARRERLDRRRSAVQGNAMRMIAGRQAQQQAFAQQQQNQMLQQMYQQDPRAATQLMAALGQNQLGAQRNQLLGQQIAGDQTLGRERLAAETQVSQQDFGLRDREITQRNEIAAKELAIREGLTQAEAEAKIAEAERSRAETGVIAQAGTPEAQERAARNELVRSYVESGQMSPTDARGLGQALRGQMGGGDALAQPAGPQTVEDAAAEIEELSPVMSAIFGPDLPTMAPEELLAEVQQREASGQPLTPQEQSMVDRFIQTQAVASPDTIPQEPGPIRSVLEGLGMGGNAPAFRGQARAAAQGQPRDPGSLTEALTGLQKLRRQMGVVLKPKNMLSPF